MPKSFAGRGKSMQNPTGLFSYRSNPVPNAKMTKPMAGPALASPANSDQMKVGKLRGKAYVERDSLRGANSI